MNAAQVRDIGVRLADALDAAHAAGVLHRDIKPANVLINRYGMVGLSDFGLASITVAGGEQSATREALTPAYAAPESFRCEEPTAAADLYSLAATLYALLTGRPPRFPADARSPGIATIMMLHSKPVDDVPGAPPELIALLRRGLAVDPAARPRSAAQLRDALSTLAAWPAGSPVRTVTAAGRGHLGRPAPADVPVRAGTPVPAGTATPADVPVRAGTPVPAGTPAPAGTPVPVGTAVRQGTPAGSGSGDAPAGWAPAERPARGRRQVMRPVTLVGALIMIIAAAIVSAHLLPRGASATAAPAASPGNGPGPGAVPEVFGVPTMTSGCPAASVRAAAARCPQAPECWYGETVLSGSDSARSVPCTGSHVWETFAIGILPADVQTYDQNIVAADPTVRAVCSPPVLLKSRRGRARQIPASSWEIDVLPPDKPAFYSGARAYRCIAHVLTGRESSTSEFGR